MSWSEGDSGLTSAMMMKMSSSHKLSLLMRREIRRRTTADKAKV